MFLGGKNKQLNHGDTATPGFHGEISFFQPGQIALNLVTGAFLKKIRGFVIRLLMRCSGAIAAGYNSVFLCATVPPWFTPNQKQPHCCGCGRTNRVKRTRVWE
jgi:hypothetical protein